MKLAVPSPCVRFIIHPDSVIPVVGGTFPPEDAYHWRCALQEAANEAWPSIRDEIERQQARWIHQMIYGHPGETEPRGLLSA